MTTEDQIAQYLADQPAAKQAELRELHERLLKDFPGIRLWYSDGRDETGKVVTNPTIGYGEFTIRYADGTTKQWHRIGIGANKTGISVYILGLKDKTHLATAYGNRIGKASVTGYCVRFKSLKDIDVDVLQEAMRYGIQRPND